MKNNFFWLKKYMAKSYIFRERSIGLPKKGVEGYSSLLNQQLLVENGKYFIKIGDVLVGIRTVGITEKQFVRMFRIEILRRFVLYCFWGVESDEFSKPKK
jgi:hypothetical protein